MKLVALKNGVRGTNQEKEIRLISAKRKKESKKEKKGKEKNIYYISSKMMLGSDREATVDGIHFTDVGMMRYADLVTPVIKKLLKK